MTAQPNQKCLWCKKMFQFGDNSCVTCSEHNFVTFDMDSWPNLTHRLLTVILEWDEWIPCTVVPPIDAWVLVMDTDGGVYVAETIRFKEIANWYTEDGKHIAAECWRPIPPKGVR